MSAKGFVLSSCEHAAVQVGDLDSLFAELDASVAASRQVCVVEDGEGDCCAVACVVWRVSFSASCV